MKTAQIAAVAFVLGALVMRGVDRSVADRQLTALRTHSDSVAVAAAARDSTATSRGDSLVALVDALQRSKRPVTVVVRDVLATARADSAVAAARTAADSNAALVVEVAALKTEVVGLESDAVADSRSIFFLRQRGDSLQAAVHDLSGQVRDLNVRIQGLHRPPTLGIKLLKGASYVATAAGAYYIGRLAERTK